MNVTKDKKNCTQLTNLMINIYKFFGTKTRNLTFNIKKINVSPNYTFNGYLPIHLVDIFKTRTVNMKFGG